MFDFNFRTGLRKCFFGKGKRRPPIVNRPRRLRLGFEVPEDRIVPNAAPIATSDSFALVHDTLISVINLKNYVSDADNDPLTISIIDPPSGATASNGSSTTPAAQCPDGNCALASNPNH